MASPATGTPVTPQFAAVLQLLSVPPPFQVRVAADAGPMSNIPIANAMEIRYRISLKRDAVPIFNRDAVIHSLRI
jgi:hypothetical protein